MVVLTIQQPLFSSGNRLGLGPPQKKSPAFRATGLGRYPKTRPSQTRAEGIRMIGVTIQQTPFRSGLRPMDFVHYRTDDVVDPAELACLVRITSIRRDWPMADEPANAAKRKAARFLALALEARERGNNELAEMLTEAANSVLENAAELEATYRRPHKNLSSLWPNSSNRYSPTRKKTDRAIPTRRCNPQSPTSSRGQPELFPGCRPNHGAEILAVVIRDGSRRKASNAKPHCYETSRS